MPKRTQANRIAAITTPLGADVLLLRAASIREELGRPFRIEAELFSENHNVEADKLIGQPACIRLDLPGGKSRFYHGLVCEFSAEDSVEDLTAYRATIVPWIWLLTRTSDCAIFQNKKIPDIVKEVFADYQGGKFDLGLSATYEPREFVVEYRETDFNFVSRLLEHEGITYFFEHTDANHTLILADNPGAFGPFPGFDSFTYAPGGFDRSDAERITSWRVVTHLTPAKVALNDFDPLVPGKALLKETTAAKPAATGAVYDYPGDYAAAAAGENYAKMRLQEIRNGFQVAHGVANCRALAVGRTFTVKEGPGSSAGKKWLVTSADTRITVDEYRAAAAPSQGSFRTSFTAVDASVPYRTPRTTPRPLISGPQTAIIVGVSGEEVTVDEHARVKVKFHWDRYAEGKETDSCWIRVAQAWAGKSWGAMFIPRHGQEVVVEFLEGDPDRPIITGRVYNGANKPPYKLPDNKTMSGVKSDSSKGGGGFNEIRFEDLKGSEQIFINAEKNMDVRVKDSRFTTILKEDHTTVTENVVEEFKKDHQYTVGQDAKFKVTRDLSETIVGKASTDITKTLSLTVGEDVGEEFKAGYSMTVTKDAFIKAENICIEAGTNITIKVGQTSIAIDSSGILLKCASGEVTLDALNVTAKASAAFKAEGSANAEVKGGLATFKADGICTVSGGLVKIN